MRGAGVRLALLVLMLVCVVYTSAGAQTKTKTKPTPSPTPTAAMAVVVPGAVCAVCSTPAKDKAEKEREPANWFTLGNTLIWAAMWVTIVIVVTNAAVKIAAARPSSTR